MLIDIGVSRFHRLGPCSFSQPLSLAADDQEKGARDGGQASHAANCDPNDSTD